MSTTYELSGIVHSIDETKSFASGFQKREFVIETVNEKFPQQIKMEAVKDACAILDLYQEGDEICVSFNIRGNEYNGKHYVNLQAWKFDRSKNNASSNSRQPSQAARPTQKQAPAPSVGDLGDDEDDIPF